MLLTIDIGNTTLTLGLFEGQKLGARWRLATDQQRLPDEYGLQILGLLQNGGCSIAQLDGVCLSSVVPPITNRIITACKQYLNQDPFVVDYSIKTGVKILYENPSAVGSDRICDAAAVLQLYGGPACVVDFGTATTFNAITQAGEYLGGAISPGINISAEALYTHTAKLQRVEMVAPAEVIGRNTVNAIQSGLVYGYVSLVEGMVARFRKVLGEDMKVIATGGYAEIVGRETAVFNIIAPWLTLYGMRILWDMNH
ncbi:panthothenate kinase [Longilinea arvoryzae]|uniref:Type III pantothenate kinase n=1 Tax=Longilinea arvoryzae TaxID=360412 RepID=A0A0S7B9W4_9CHLR|nr:type III pantothenate kinase [Longilinea arvoryzae]GAP14142.1 panthothenate kinase [Longilinea arvoryzae]